MFISYLAFYSNAVFNLISPHLSMFSHWIQSGILIWGRISALFQFKNELKTSQNGVFHPNFLVLHFGENILKTGTKIAKLQMHKKFIKILMKTCFH